MDRYAWVLQQLYFFGRRFADAATISEGLTEPDGVDRLYATLAYAQLGRPADLQRWRTRLLADGPDLSDEWIRWSWAEGMFVLPQAELEALLWRESLAAAAIPQCATPKQLARTGMTPLPECEAARAKRQAGMP